MVTDFSEGEDYTAKYSQLPWTTRRVASLLKQVFGVSYHPGHVSRLLQKHHPGWRGRKQK